MGKFWIFGLGFWVSGERQARLALAVSMGHSRMNETGAAGLACLIRSAKLKECVSQARFLGRRFPQIWFVPRLIAFRSESS